MAVVRNPGFRVSLGRPGYPQIGDGLNKVALLWFVYELTGSALKMTAIGLLQTIPPLVFGPLIGVYPINSPRKSSRSSSISLRTLMVLLILLFIRSICSRSSGYMSRCSLSRSCRPSSGRLWLQPCRSSCNVPN